MCATRLLSWSASKGRPLIDSWSKEDSELVVVLKARTAPQVIHGDRPSLRASSLEESSRHAEVPLRPCANWFGLAEPQWPSGDAVLPSVQSQEITAFLKTCCPKPKTGKDTGRRVCPFCDIANWKHDDESSPKRKRVLSSGNTFLPLCHCPSSSVAPPIANAL